VPPRQLKLTKYVFALFLVFLYVPFRTVSRLDDEIYEHLMSTFPELAEPPHNKLVNLDEDWMKSAEGKERWRSFIQV